MRSQAWREKIEDKSLTLAGFEDALLDWDNEVEGLQLRIAELEAELAHLSHEKELTLS